MGDINFKAAIEAMVFASGEPVPINKLAEILGINVPACRQQVDFLIKEYNKENRGIIIVKLNDNIQMCTKNEFADYVRRCIEVKRDTPLSQAAMEVLAIIAYNEPVTKNFIEQVRGVDSSQIVNSLVVKGLILEAGRMDVPGRPVSYKTSLNFLRYFNLGSLSELPEINENGKQITIDEILKEDDVSS